MVSLKYLLRSLDYAKQQKQKFDCLNDLYQFTDDEHQVNIDELRELVKDRDAKVNS